MSLERDVFFDRMESQGIALTFDDVRLETNRSDTSATDVSITSQFSRNVELQAPLVSAAMDTVTNSEMAIAMAKLGGIGVIHAVLGAKEQRDEVRRVKLHLNGRIEKPVTVTPGRTLESVLNECTKRDFDFRTFPVVDQENRLIGMLTQNDFDFQESMSRRVGKVMTPISEILSAPSDTSLTDAYQLMQKNKKKTVPLVNEDGTVAGLYILSDVKRIVGGDLGQYNVDNNGRLRVAAAVPTDPEQAVERIHAMSNYLDVVVIDSAQGDSSFSFKTLERLKEEFPDLDVVVGNVTNGLSAKELAAAGADGIKVGQGPGSICTTRVETGIGCPQVTAVYQCAQAVESYGIPVCADGGIRNNGDISIALAAGASSVMMGGMLAGTDEAPGDVLQHDDGSLWKKYIGMGAAIKMRESTASRKRYGADGKGEPLAEGVESEVPYIGSVNTLLGFSILALRRSLDYVGAPDLETHRRKTRFYMITNNGINESRPHDVVVSPSRR